MTEHEQIITDVMHRKQRQRVLDQLDEYETTIKELETINERLDELNAAIEHDFKWAMRIAAILLAVPAGLIVAIVLQML